MINTKLQSIIDTKAAIGNAITNKGGTITTNTPFFNYAAQIDGISTGTPQTIFAASDGSKWALTNAVNLVNDAGNVTHDFNYWQPANNSTSDPILNVGTVGANISGNIQLVPVNQVNIAQYVNLVATDTDGAKYEGFNGFDANTNPTPTGNTTFNRWLLNNSASGTVIFANATFTTGTYNGPNASLDDAMTFVNSSNDFGGQINQLKSNNAFIYAVGDGAIIRKYHESNLTFNANSATFGNFSTDNIAINNGFVYITAVSNFFPNPNNGRIGKFHESNLVFSANGPEYGGFINSIIINNGFFYMGGQTNARVHKVGESNLTRVGTTNAYGDRIFNIASNNGSIFVGGIAFSFGNASVQKYHESNLVLQSNSSAIFGAGNGIRAIVINNGYVYAAGDSRIVEKFHESNLVSVGNTANYGGIIYSLSVNNGFLYVGGASNNRVQAFYESNLAFINSSNSYGGNIISVITNNSFIYAGGVSNQRIQKFNEITETADIQTFYTATKIKE
jgi:hypothetical protein